MKKATQLSVKKIISKSMAIILSTGIGMGILYSAAGTPKESEKCAKLRKELEKQKKGDKRKNNNNINTKENKKDLYLGTTKSAAPEAFRVFHLENDYNRECNPDKMLQPVIPEKKTNEESNKKSPSQSPLLQQQE